MKTIKDFCNKDYDYVSYRLTYPNWKDEYLQNEDDIYEHSMFAGAFKIKDGEIIPLDGDCYSYSEEVIWATEWSNKDKNIENGLDIIILGHWYSKEDLEEED